MLGCGGRKHIQMTIDGKEEDMDKKPKKFVKASPGTAALSLFNEQGEKLGVRDGMTIDEAKRVARSLDRADINSVLTVTITYRLV